MQPRRWHKLPEGSDAFQSSDMLHRRGRPNLHIDNVLDKRRRRLGLDIIDVSCQNAIVTVASNRRKHSGSGCSNCRAAHWLPDLVSDRQLLA